MTGLPLGRRDGVVAKAVRPVAVVAAWAMDAVAGGDEAPGDRDSEGGDDRAKADHSVGDSSPYFWAASQPTCKQLSDHHSPSVHSVAAGRSGGAADEECHDLVRDVPSWSLVQPPACHERRATYVCRCEAVEVTAHHHNRLSVSESTIGVPSQTKVKAAPSRSADAKRRRRPKRVPSVTKTKKRNEEDQPTQPRRPMTFRRETGWPASDDGCL